MVVTLLFQNKIFIGLLMMVIACGAALTMVSQHVYDKQKQIRKMERHIALKENEIKSLQAEWAYLNNPARLAQLKKAQSRANPQKTQRMAMVSSVTTPSKVSFSAPSPVPVAKPVLRVKKSIQPPEQSSNFSALLTQISQR